MSKTHKTRPTTEGSQVFGLHQPVPGLLLASTPPGAKTIDRCAVTSPFNVGRSSRCNLPLNDDKISAVHFCISEDIAGYRIEDLNSTNGTCLNGAPVTGKQPLFDNSVIRAGQSVFLFHTDAAPLLSPPPTNAFDFAGRFHVGPLVQQIREAARSSRHILLCGPSGTGKELTARALAALMDTAHNPPKLVIHNAARFSSEEEATTTLFGVAARVFSSVSARAGLLEQAQGGVLFLDEVHILPERVQKSLLRVIEDGKIARFGESQTRNVELRFILASNNDGPRHGLTHDLLARLRVVMVPPLAERIADIPEIFTQLLESALEKNDINPQAVQPHLRADHYEAMCLDGFRQDNVRGIIDLTDRIVSGINTGREPESTIADTFNCRFGTGPVARRHSKFIEQTSACRIGAPSSPLVSAEQTDEELANRNSYYERQKKQIIEAYLECNGNLSASERLLRSRGIHSTRRWIGIFMKKWGLRS